MATPAPKQESLAITSLVLACASIMFGPFTGLPAIICGHISRSRIKKNPELSGSGLALAGLILGYLFSVFSILVLLSYFVSPTPIQK